MTTLFVRHMVSDYKNWRKAYDAFSSVQRANGVTAEAVYQATDNPNDVTVTHEFATLEAAQAFIKLEELSKAMQSGGVVGTPTVWFTQKV
ncbi:cyclase [Phyllobacterium zundukense]|uniref:Cyclase n=1 Tax=Phyllobacterium zundukense TaxID=1867719 RepID=A0A2N9W430_9HYPH|nr:cyclase [Phyllobacterium zundukense]ATU92031.1 cyclase [Phyllobacterium zundukense]PIO46498.1 cyclase [Phyllobacterium zundukense]